MYKLDMEDKQEHDMEGRNTILSYGDVSVVISDKCKDQVIFDLHERIVKKTSTIMFSICYFRCIVIAWKNFGGKINFGEASS